MSSYPKRLQLYLSDELSKLAMDEAKTRGISIAAVIREALAEYFAKREGMESDDPIWKIPAVSRTYDSRSPGDLSSKRNEYLYGREDEDEDEA